MSLLRRRSPAVAAVRTPRQRAGDAAEAAACAKLQAAGCRILARNVRYREGEIDIVADDRGTLVFVEVRMRRSDRFGGAAGSIDAFKRRRLVRAAQHFLLAALRRRLAAAALPVRRVHRRRRRHPRLDPRCIRL